MNPLLREVDRLGNSLVHASGDFSSTARELLSAVPFHEMFSSNNVEHLRERHRSNAHLLEHDCAFSDECLVLFVHETFTIELYHWLYSDTGIHDHNFQGAFQCLEGEDHQVEFEFREPVDVFEGLERGELLQMKESVLRPGDTQEIRNQDRFIHAVAHAPSTWNLTIRTKGDFTQVLKAYHVDGYRYALRKEREQKLQLAEVSAENIAEFDSCDLLHLFHMLVYKPGHHEMKKQIAGILEKRHDLPYLRIMENTADFLNDLGKVAKNY